MNKFIGMGLYAGELSTISCVWEILVLLAGMIAIIIFFGFLSDGCSKRTLLISIAIMTLGFIEWTFVGLWTTMAFCIFAHCCRAFYWITDNYDYFNKCVKLLSDGVASLDFDTIKNLYELNPKRFSFAGYRECFYTPACYDSINVCIPSRIEYLKYTLWRYKAKKLSKRLKNLKRKVKKINVMLKLLK